MERREELEARRARLDAKAVEAGGALADASMHASYLREHGGAAVQIARADAQADRLASLYRLVDNELFAVESQIRRETSAERPQCSA